MGATEIIQAHSAICQRCRHCVRECPVKALKVTVSVLEVDSDRCLYCGRCVSACSQSALVGRSDSQVVRLFTCGVREADMSGRREWSRFEEVFPEAAGDPRASLARLEEMLRAGHTAGSVGLPED